MRNTMLHILNFFWVGGAPMFVKDMMGAYRQFHHVIVYLNDRMGGAPAEDYEMMQRWRWDTGCSIGFAESKTITKALIEQIDPAIIVFHCTPLNKLEGKRPYEWLNQWPKIYIHHMVTMPIIPSQLHMFVSDYVKQQYEDQLKQMQRWLVCPPTINAQTFSNLPRAPDNKRCVVGKYSSDWHKDKYPDFYLSVVRNLAGKYSNASFEIVGGEKYYGKVALPGLSMPPARSKEPVVFMKGCDIFVYAVTPGFKETWCRVVSEAMASGLPVVIPPAGGLAEQIEDGVHGFFCETEAQYIEKISKLIEDPKLRYDMGMRARERAVKHFGLDRLKRELSETLVGALAGTL